LTMTDRNLALPKRWATKLGWLEGDEERSVESDKDGPELGAAETMGDELGELEGDVEG
jgi:hypothetical protein